MSAQPRVQFAEYSEIASFEVEGDAVSKFYSREDFKRFQLGVVRNVRRMAPVMTRPGGTRISPEEHEQCLGIEKLLSRGISRGIAEQILNHTRAILQMQGVCSPKELGHISSTSSGPSSAMALRLAANIANP